MDHERAHRNRIRIGVGVCTYQGIALAVDRPDLVPRITDVSHRWPWVGWGLATWCVAHLAAPGLYPWFAQRVRWPARR